MPSIKDLKKRIGSVKNTQQTTRAMKMVSAAKLRRAQEAIQNQRPYANEISLLMQELAAFVKLSENHPVRKLIGHSTGMKGSVNESSPMDSDHSRENQKKKILLVLVTSDRGLCGGFNSSVIKAAQRWLNSQTAQNADVTLGFIGKRGYDFFRNRKFKVGPFYQELSGKVTFQKAKKLSDSLIEFVSKGEFNEVKFIFNEFVNAVLQKVSVEDFIPLPSQSQGKANSESAHLNIVQDFIVKPSPESVFFQLVEKHFPVQAFRILLESQAGEHGARMSAMENATKNAGEMIRKLTLQYNKQRQAGITKELLEIISGTESQKGN